VIYKERALLYIERRLDQGRRREKTNEVNCANQDSTDLTMFSISNPLKLGKAHGSS